MVNAPATETLTGDTTLANDRRGRGRAPLIQSNPLGQAKLNPFGDLHTLQHLSARLARPLRGVLEPMLREEVRTFAEPLVVQRFADYRAERPDRLTAWVPLQMAPNDGIALIVMDGRFVLELLDIFFGGTGAAPDELPGEFSPAADALIARLTDSITTVMKSSWEPVARIAFTAGRVEANPSMLGGVDAEDAMIVTRFGIGRGTRKPVFLDIVYPVTALKPHGTALTGKVVGKGAEPDAGWRNALTRSTMAVKFPVRSVLAEPVVPLSMLMTLKEGDVIPIIVSHDVPVMVGGDRFGAGTVGTSNGRAAIRITQLTRTDEGLPQ
ncbi:Flagellar motor switch protein FliM [Sphingomonas sp. EC-HK361]|uniref:flagellar motor switch protein FliM n=1 Tax=Sphingomonas sp. EC-HK361 TaxID=2038397 RepID=UPI001255C716|nr:flagellar motor switch protein FliM [Sphingomonas sp. EC-HK361]VVT20653.1 Flagellar motor switch protein FliM [Sphingomonas sp. EC-HK361]